jgi:hypothetical protein
VVSPVLSAYVFVAKQRLEGVRWCREFPSLRDIAPETDKEDAVSDLWDSVICRVCSVHAHSITKT